MKSLQIFTVIDIIALIAGLAIYLFIVGKQLANVATNLEDAADLVWKINKETHSYVADEKPESNGANNPNTVTAHIHFFTLLPNVKLRGAALLRRPS